MAEHYFVIRHDNAFRLDMEHVVNEIVYAVHGVNLEHYEFDGNFNGAAVYLAELADSLVGIETRWTQTGGVDNIIAVSDRITL